MDVSENLVHKAQFRIEPTDLGVKADVLRRPSTTGSNHGQLNVGLWHFVIESNDAGYAIGPSS
jgi:hypothetical protein